MGVTRIVAQLMTPRRWRRWESNPRPKAFCRQSLHVYQVVLIEIEALTCRLLYSPADFSFALHPSARDDGLAHSMTFLPKLRARSRETWLLESTRD